MLLKRQPYRQVLVDNKRQMKLSAMFFGPYKVDKNIGATAYHLQSLKGLRIHLVFHVSQLKRYSLRKQIVTYRQQIQKTFQGKPLEVLQRRV